MSHSVCAKQDLLSLNLEELNLEELLAVKVITVTGQQQELDKSFASVFVITGEELQMSGVTTLAMGLTSVPGLDVSVDYVGGTVLSVRGVKSRNSEKLLVLLDGHPLNDVRSGSATFQFLDRIPVEMVHQVEVVLGPVSSIYGANAFAGVINVISRRAGEEHVAFNVQTGFDQKGVASRGVNLSYNNAESGHWQIFANAHIQKNPGLALPVKMDSFGQSGYAATNEDWYDSYFSATSEQWRIKARWYKRSSGDYFGSLFALNDGSKQQVEHQFLDVTRTWRLSSASELSLGAHFDFQKTDNAYQALPPGLDDVGSLAPWRETGLYGKLLAKTRMQGLNVKWVYSGLVNHQVVMGYEYKLSQLNNPRTFSNANPYPLPEVREVTEEYNWITPAQRETMAVYVQDIWRPTRAVRINMGFRVDSSTDYGTNVSPRLGWHWQMSERWCMRASVGTAYRAPDFYSMYLQSSPVLEGNPELDAENITSYEWALGKKISDTFAFDIIAFGSRLTDLIDENTTSLVIENIGALESYGGSMRMLFSPLESSVLELNATAVDLKHDSDYAYPNTPAKSINVKWQWQASAQWRYQASLAWRAEQTRELGDNRAPVAEYWLGNASVKYQRSPRWHFIVSVNNVLDEQYRYPSISTGLQEDFIAPGRNVSVQGRWSW